MKYTIEGFSQEYAATLKDDKNHIDCTDLVILRWFVDFQATSKMEFVDIGKDRFFWVNYNALLDDMPILSISKRALYDRFQKMVKFGILKHHHHKAGGNFSYYCTGPNYSILLSSHYEENFRTFGSKLPNLQQSTSEPSEVNFRTLGSKLPNKDQSTTNHSSKDVERIAREKHGEYGWVKLTPAEYEKLLTDYGSEKLNHAITYVDELAQSTGNKNKWKDWNLVVRRAIREGWGNKNRVEETPKKKRRFETVEIDGQIVDVEIEE